jgi:hypothetical protein
MANSNTHIGRGVFSSLRGISMRSQSDKISSRVLQKGYLPKIPPLLFKLVLIRFKSPAMMQGLDRPVFLKFDIDPQHYDFSLGFIDIYTLMI